MPIKESISIGWWNTSLAPFSKKTVSGADKDLVIGVIKNLLCEKGLDFLAVGEVSEEDFEYIKRNCTDLEGYEFVSGVRKAGKSYFDTSFIVNTSVFSVIGCVDIITNRSSSTYKIAQRIDLITLYDNEVIHIFVSHWPSRLYCEEFDSSRHLLAIRLRDAIDELLESSDYVPRVILIGDYNDEPFAKSLSEHVMATRDIGLLKKKKKMLFNPYWSLLGGNYDELSLRGSYFYKSGKYSEWHTFDQMIFSSAFFEPNGWALSDKSEHIVNISDYTQCVFNRSSRFDHLPISALIERK